MKTKAKFYARITKPMLDRLLGTIALILLSWVFLIVAAIIWIDDPGPVIFKQKRVGKKKNGQLTYFNIYKFRTMKNNAPHDVPTHLLGNADQWITRVGRFLRKSSLDELPQIWNIAVTHDISIIGPRPALWNQDDLVAERDKYGVNDIMPGLTGYAQVHGRDELSIEDKAKADGYYAENISFGLDVKCFFESIFAVIRADGYDDGMEKKKGQDSERQAY